MSYSLICKCQQCQKADKCIDQDFIAGAISGIHGVNRWDPKLGQINRGHLGSGSIEINCSNFKEKPKE